MTLARKNIRICALLALFGTGALHAGVAPKVNISVGAGLLNVANLELGYGLTKNVSIEGYLGYSLLIGTASAYLDYDYHASGSNILKLGLGPSTSFACGHGGCGSAGGVDLRTKYIFLPYSSNRFGYYGSVGYFIGKGNLFGNNPTHLPHISLGLNWRL